MGIGEWALLALAGILVLVVVLLVAPVRLRVLWGQVEKSLSISYLGLSVEFDYSHRCRRIRLLDWIIATGPWSVTGQTTPRSGHENSRHATAGPALTPAIRRPTTGLSARIRRFAAKGRLLWRFRVALRRTFMIMLRLVGRLIRAWHVERADITLAVGLGDPAQTGMATGWFYAIWSGLSERFPAWHVTWEPVFEDRVTSVKAFVVLRLIPLRAVYHLCRAFVSLPWLGLWRLRKGMRELGVEGR